MRSPATTETKTARSELTLAGILDVALEMAAREGLEGLSIGEVAKRLGLSKSGVFSRIGSREALQRAVIEEYDRRFIQEVFVPAMREPRGLPRLDAIVARWLERAANVESKIGCLYCAGAFELDDRDGPLRDLLMNGIQGWRGALRRTVIQAIEAGHIDADSDPDQIVFEIDGLFVALMREARFMRDPRAVDRARRAYERLIGSRVTAEHRTTSIRVTG